MPYDDFRLLHVSADAGVCRATIDNPPVNLLDVPLMLELDRLSREVQADDSAIARMESFLAAGGQTPDVERRPITLSGNPWT